MNDHDSASPLFDLHGSLPPPYHAPTTGLILAFLLEIAMFVCLAIWGWRLGGGGIRGGLLAALFVVVAGAVWGLCRAPGDLPHGRSRIPVPGPVRLAIEFALLGLAAYGVWASGLHAAGETLLTAGAVHYALGWERVQWLLRGSRSGR